MRHLNPISRSKSPSPAMTLLEKQAFSDMLMRNLSQIAAFISLLTGLKPQEP